MRKFVLISIMLSTFVAALPMPFASAEEVKTLNTQDDGYRGIWYYNQKSGDEYVYKYSGGLGTYCAKHQPFAVHRPEVQKTFFCYGGTTSSSNRELVHCVSYFDHRTGQVPRPTVLLNKQTDDAHDNPVIAVDAAGFIWIFSTSHGRSRPSFIHKSHAPYQIDQFERVDARYDKAGAMLPLDNFSYMQTWHVPEQGFVSFFTRYKDPADRTSMFMTSRDGVQWSPWQRIAAIEAGHYQISCAGASKAACAFNYHPAGRGLNWRTNLYYVETSDLGRSWQSASNQPLQLPLTGAENDALVHDYASEGLNVYLKDIRFDSDGRPVILILTSGGYQSGPANNPRTWRVVCWTGTAWRIHPITTSDNNYDMGSLYIEANNHWRLIAPTEVGPQPFNPGGEIAAWVSQDAGRTWKKERQLTSTSDRNHTYARRPVNAHPDFYSLWADGHGRKPSESRLYFCNQAGDVFVLPARMDGSTARPQLWKRSE